MRAAERRAIQDAQAVQHRLERERIDHHMQVTSMMDTQDYLEFELHQAREQLDDLELCRAQLEINNGELFTRLHRTLLAASASAGPGPGPGTGTGTGTALVPVPTAARNADGLSGADGPYGAEEEESSTATMPLCVCCVSAPVEAVLACGHATTCVTCVERMIGLAREEGTGAARCPVCRVPLDRDEWDLMRADRGRPYIRMRFA